MEIKTKYNIDDKVYTLYNNRIICGSIYDINIKIDYIYNIQIKYLLQDPTYVRGDVYFEEHKVFKTKEELLEKLSKCDSL